VIHICTNEDMHNISGKLLTRGPKRYNLRKEQTIRNNKICSIASL
jgi:hypothetical protein